MSNDEILNHIREMLKSNYFTDSVEFQKFVKQISISIPILVQAITDLFNSLFALSTENVDFMAEQFNKLFEEYPDDSDEITPYVKHLAIHSKKFRVLKTNYKRLWKRQKIP